MSSCCRVCRLYVASVHESAISAQADAVAQEASRREIPHARVPQCIHQGGLSHVIQVGPGNAFAHGGVVQNDVGEHLFSFGTPIPAAQVGQRGNVMDSGRGVKRRAGGRR